ncbi:Ig-like domain-containing protein [Actinomyces sp. zg296]|uniref:Ig-like domain-containing protein n=1 Tax=Actinomyces sp. zg296 TaxID=2609289 RepID=UPI00135B9708|nr:Ig-like domain-containing protein [Actinomyces sp. zg296]
MRRSSALAAGALVAAGAFVPAAVSTQAQAADSDNIKVTDVKVTSEARQRPVNGVAVEAWDKVSLQAKWEATAPKAGNSFTVKLGDGLEWSGSLGFDLLDQNGSDVGNCTFTVGSQDMTCTLTAGAEKWDKLTNGTLIAQAQINNKGIGLKQSTVKVGPTTAPIVFGDSNGDGTCDTGCDGVKPNYPEPNPFKSGWFNGVNDQGKYVFMWEVRAQNTGGAKNTHWVVKDPGATYVANSVLCTTGSWQEGKGVANVKVAPGWPQEQVEFDAPSAEAVCRVRFYTTTEPTKAAQANTATVNGQTYSRSGITATEAGSGNALGGKNPAPAPSPKTTTPAPTPSASQSATPAPTPSASQSVTPSAAPSASESATPAPTPSASESATPSAAPSAPETTVPAPTPSASESAAPSDPALPTVPATTQAAAPRVTPQQPGPQAPKDPAAPTAPATTQAAAAAPGPQQLGTQAPKSHAVPAAPANSQPTSKPSLAKTGASILVPALIAGAVIGGGVVLVRRGRRA